MFDTNEPAYYLTKCISVLSEVQWRSQPDFWLCYANISVFMDRENNQSLKKLIMIMISNMHSMTKLSGWLPHCLERFFPIVHISSRSVKNYGMESCCFSLLLLKLATTQYLIKFDNLTFSAIFVYMSCPRLSDPASFSSLLTYALRKGVSVASGAKSGRLVNWFLKWNQRTPFQLVYFS